MKEHVNDTASRRRRLAGLRTCVKRAGVRYEGQDESLDRIYACMGCCEPGDADGGPEVGALSPE